MASRPSIKAQLGFSLIETLIAMLVLSVGLLGLGGLQLSALKGANNAHFRTVASLAVTDLIDRMRANPIGVTSGLYTATLGRVHCESASALLCEADVECDAADRASYDLYRVNCGVNDGLHQTGGVQYDLPQALLVIGCASIACANGEMHHIKVSWQESNNGDADAAAQFRSYELSFIP